MKVLLALTLVALVSAQVPTPCESPKQWEAAVLRVDKMGTRPEEERIRVSYDETNQRVREIEQFFYNPTPSREIYEVIYLHKEQKEYRININTRQCNVSALTRPFRPMGVPSGATFDGFATLGAAGIPGESMTLQTWSSTDQALRFNGAVTYPDCVPVQYTAYEPPSRFIVSTIFDVQVGIKDPNVFNPPAECTK